MIESKMVINKIDMGECPFCKNKQFFISEFARTNYITNRDGEVIDSSETKYDAVGICTKCGKKYQMKPLAFSFIPMTPLRQFMDKYVDYDKKMPEDDFIELPNPMQRKR